MEADFADLIVKHEGLEPGQTPFRITNPEMAKWKTIHGKKINHKAVKSKGRENFFYLEKPDEVKPAVEQQFKNYYQVPAKYNLPSNPTVEQAVRVFDQSGADGKLKMLKDNGVDVSQPLSNIFNQTELARELDRQFKETGKSDKK